MAWLPTGLITAASIEVPFSEDPQTLTGHDLTLHLGSPSLEHHQEAGAKHRMTEQRVRAVLEKAQVAATHLPENRDLHSMFRRGQPAMSQVLLNIVSRLTMPGPALEPTSSVAE